MKESTKEGRLAKVTEQMLAGNRGAGHWCVTRAKGMEWVSGSREHPTGLVRTCQVSETRTQMCP